MATDVQQLPGEGFVRLPQILAVIPISRSTWWNWVRDGTAPPGIKLGPRTTAWKVSDIRDLIERTARSAG
jgi:predicted DNA-binding transcriptional regulator AlpA